MNFTRPPLCTKVGPDAPGRRSPDVDQMARLSGSNDVGGQVWPPAQDGEYVLRPGIPIGVAW